MDNKIEILGERRFNLKSTHIMITLITSLFLVAIIAIIGSAATITVGPPGSSANYNSIQDAINNANNGDTILVWNGTYNENVIVDKMVSIIGNGSAWCKVIADDNTSDVLHVTADYVNISGLNISGANDSDIAGLRILSSHCNVSSCIMYGNYYGIEVSPISGNVDNNSLYDNMIYGNVIGIGASYSRDLNVSSNIIYDNTRYGIRFDVDISNSTVFNNTVYDNGWDGILVGDDYNVVIGNTIYGNGWNGVRLSSASRNIIRSNIIHDNAYNGVEIYSDSLYNLVDNNTIYNNGKGILFSASPTLPGNNTLVNNTIYGNSYGIFCEGMNNTMEGNLIYNNSNGIYIPSSANNTISNNTVYNCTYGIYLYSSNNNTVVNCNVYNNSYQGIYLYSSHYNNLYHNNVSNTTGYYGIYLYNSSNNTFIGNRIWNNKWGVYLGRNTGGSFNNTLRDNLVYNNTWDGFLIEYSDYNIIFNNTVTNNTMYGIDKEEKSSTDTQVMRLAIESVILLLSPFVPHFSEELWEKLGYDSSIIFQPWPSFRQDALLKDTILIVVQVNGKLRSRFNVDADTDEDTLKKIALEDERVLKFVDNKPIKKVIVVKKKLVNIVV